MEKKRFIEIIGFLKTFLEYNHGLCICLSILEAGRHITIQEKQFFFKLFDKEFPPTWYDINGNESRVLGRYRFLNNESRINFLNGLIDDADYHI